MAGTVVFGHSTSVVLIRVCNISICVKYILIIYRIRTSVGSGGGYSTGSALATPAAHALSHSMPTHGRPRASAARTFSVPWGGGWMGMGCNCYLLTVCIQAKIA